MKKKTISFLIIGIMVHFLCACGRTESAESHYTVSEPIQDEASENEPMRDETSQDETTQDETSQNESFCEIPDCLAAYVDYTEKLEAEYKDNKWPTDFTYSFIYVDADDIPELVIYPGASWYHILTFHDGEIDELTTDRTTVCYMEKKNLLDNCSGAMGFYHDYIYSIENGKWVYVTGGEYSDGVDDSNNVYFTFRWEGEEVTEDRME